MTEPTPIIRLEGISKAFGPVQANRDITLDIQAGRILALLGENGAGKSTLMSILAGQIRPDSGRILLQGEPVVFTSTEQAIEAGVFGAPTFVVTDSGQRFWGQDRLDFLDRHLATL